MRVADALTLSSHFAASMQVGRNPIMRFAGYTKGGTFDNLMTSEQLDQKRRLA